MEITRRNLLKTAPAIVPAALAGTVIAAPVVEPMHPFVWVADRDLPGLNMVAGDAALVCPCGWHCEASYLLSDGRVVALGADWGQGHDAFDHETGERSKLPPSTVRADVVGRITKIVTPGPAGWDASTPRAV